MEKHLILFRPSRRSNIYVVDEYTGTVYASCRSKRDQWRMYYLAQQFMSTSGIEPLTGKKIDAVQAHYNNVFGFGDKGIGTPLFKEG